MLFQRCHALVLLALVGCDQLDRTSIASKLDESVPVPEFSVRLTMTPMAAAKLESLREAVTVTVFFDGDGNPEPGVKTAPNRDVFLGFAELPLGENNAATFKGLTVPAKSVKRLYDPDYYVGVNGSSSRLTQPTNLLACGFAEGKISQVSKTGLTLHCSLIEEALTSGTKQ